MCKVISTVSWKGGVGKTTSVVNISSYLHLQGKKVCVIDLDLQCSLTKHLGINTKNILTIYDLFEAEIKELETEHINQLINKAIVKSSTVDVIVATPKLSALNMVLPTVTCRELILKRIISLIKDKYNYIFIDCHPGSDLLAINALAASDSVLFPVEAHILSADGLEQVEKMIRSVQRHLNPDLKIEGIIITKFQARTKCCRNTSELIKQNFGDRIHIFEDYIKYNVDVADAPSYGVSIHEFSPKSKAALAYAKIASEVM